MSNQTEKTPRINKADFARRLRKLREKKEFTIAEVANKIGKTEKTYSSWESPKSLALPGDLNALVILCELYDTTLDFMVRAMYDSSLSPRADEKYLSIYDRYKTDAEFYFIISVLLNADDRVLASISELMEAINSAYRPR